VRPITGICLEDASEKKRDWFRKNTKGSAKKKHVFEIQQQQGGGGGGEKIERRKKKGVFVSAAFKGARAGV